MKAKWRQKSSQLEGNIPGIAQQVVDGKRQVDLHNIGNLHNKRKLEIHDHLTPVSIKEIHVIFMHWFCLPKHFLWKMIRVKKLNSVGDEEEYMTNDGQMGTY